MTGTRFTGTGTSGSASNQFKDPDQIYIDANDTIYVADHHNNRIQMFYKNNPSGITVTSGSNSQHPEGVTGDQDGNIYLAGHNYDLIRKFTPTYSNSSIAAGGISSKTASHIVSDPLGMVVDSSMNLYVAERTGKRVSMWMPGVTSEVVVIDGSSTGEFHGIVLSRIYSNKAFVSSETTDTVYLWQFNSTSPEVPLTQVNDPAGALVNPRGLARDQYGNVYVADKGNGRIVMYCENSTMGRVVAGGTGSSPTLVNPVSVALDSNLNLFVVDDGTHSIIKFSRI